MTAVGDMTAWDDWLPEDPAARRLLRERAVRLARRAVDVTPVAITGELLAFRLGQEVYALDTRWVREVVPLAALTPVPMTPAYVIGLLHVRGEIYSVLDVQRLFGLPERGLSNRNKAVLLGDGRMAFGLLADEMVGVFRPAAAPAPPPDGLAAFQGGAAWLLGVLPDGTVVLDAAALLADERLVVKDAAGNMPR